MEYEIVPRGAFDWRILGPTIDYISQNIGPLDMLENGSIVGSYRIVTELGAGGMGEVFFAEHTTIARRAAIKFIRSEFSANAEVVERFLAEARSVNEIRHPNIVEITDFGQLEERYYIVMELLEGETLQERMARLGPLPEEDVVAMVMQIAAAVGAAHEKGVVHRDLKPENIFLTNHPDYPNFV
ncbi:MAG: serine/threonine-protein kinase, partial [Myxococcota bacterium]